MTIHAMIDLETLDLIPTSTVLSVGACKFDPYTTREPQDKILWRPDVDEQLAAGRSADEGVLEWWATQPQDIQEQAFSSDERVPLDEFFKALNKYLVGVDKIWAQGPQFDMIMLEDLYRQFDHHMGWSFWQQMDSRTLFQMMPRDPRKDIQSGLHDASEDAYWQAVSVQKSYKHFNVTHS